MCRLPPYPNRQRKRSQNPSSVSSSLTGGTTRAYPVQGRGIGTGMDKDPAERQQEIVGQSDDSRDPADDSGEMDDPTEMAANYPGAFDGGDPAAAADAIADHDLSRDVRRGGAIGAPASPDHPRSPRREGNLDAAAD